ncbi:MAG: ATP-binding cassette domain-containing protein [Deltaproteobacteria bacterium]|nr:MAG: ATP-binding cassette domain-containing protein [Deltaproteobacteria bacterium]
MLNVIDVTQSFGARTLFENVNVQFTPGKRYGLTGPNGAGKSTFMKFLAGDEQPSRGEVTRPERTSILRQNHFIYDTETTIDVVMMGNKRLWKAMEEKERILKHAETTGEFTDEMGMQLGELEGIVGEEDGYTAEADAGMLLSGLGIPENLHCEPMNALSSGMRFRVLLAQALFGKPECLLLDEPTNHLDMDSVAWLEQFLQRYEGVLVVISHDRHFLNAVATHIADIDYQTIITYTGNYDEAVYQKSQIRSRVESENEDRLKKVSQLKDFINRFSAGSRASQVQSRKKELARLQPHELKRSNIQRPFIRFDIGDKASGKDVLRVRGLHKTFHEEGKEPAVICEGLDLDLRRGERLAIIGPSGIGKTSLVRMLMNEIQPDRGEIIWGHETRVGYFAQDHSEEMPEGVPLWQWLNGFDDKADRETIRGLLGRMLFSGEEAEKPVHVLSGGETVRALFARLMLVKNNVILLDEPTNHLDLESISALGEGLAAYKGTAIFVTHDRTLVEEAATHVLRMTPKGVQEFTREDPLFERIIIRGERD